MTDRGRLPDDASKRARAFLATGTAPVPARPASTVVLVRDGAEGLEVYTQRRHTSMAFASGMVAFPGGRVDPADTVAPADLDQHHWARRLGTTPQAATGFVNAALRETTEETGVRLHASALRPWAHWITPRFETRRYDTWFFVAAAPRDQEPQDISGEASAVAWIAPREALDRAVRGEWLMLLPTWTVLEELSAYSSAGAVLGAERRIDTITPGWIDDGEHVYSLPPDDPRYPGDDPTPSHGRRRRTGP
ncbi:NUDIX domain-containing protein [Phytoactinopolyspora alkaliphila]|uniref:NUDIX domain-containing protein n=1 Tax=Phytoactinopolyspora alkaliphila TaxID=1783498 RepID=A0A6N9YLR9_9ACTN|nr:NUDIX domain-containing protein [Phytoactinopolyspora alkaliphila]NED95819.1 NUDIX domain-containing protein [Phytoactinopolyspora alkaliphila]